MCFSRHQLLSPTHECKMGFISSVPAALSQTVLWNAGLEKAHSSQCMNWFMMHLKDFTQYSVSAWVLQGASCFLGIRNLDVAVYFSTFLLVELVVSTDQITWSCICTAPHCSSNHSLIHKTLCLSAQMEHVNQKPNTIHFQAYKI